MMKSARVRWFCWVLFGLTGLITGCDKNQSTPTHDAGATYADHGLTPDSGLAPTAEPFAKTELLVSKHGLFLQVRFEGHLPVLMLYDTGAPFTYLVKSEAQRLGLSEGPVQASLEQVSLGSRTLLVMDRPPSGPYEDLPQQPIVGTVGNDFFDPLGVGLDFRSRLLWLFKDLGPEEIPQKPTGTGPAVAVPLEQPLGYLVVGCGFEDAPATKDCLFDTGSPDSMAMESYWLTLQHPSAHTVPTFSVDVHGQLLTGYYQRTRATKVGDFVRTNDYVAVFGKFALLDQVSKIIGRSIVGLVGVATVLSHFTVLDYANDRILFFAYPDGSHLPPSPFLGFGFISTGSASGGLEVRAVVEGSNAQKAGVQAGDELLRIDGQEWWLVPDLSFSVAFIITGEIGKLRSFTFLRQNAEYTVALVAEDLLPPSP